MAVACVAKIRVAGSDDANFSEDLFFTASCVGSGLAVFRITMTNTAAATRNVTAANTTLNMEPNLRWKHVLTHNGQQLIVQQPIGCQQRCFFDRWGLAVTGCDDATRFFHKQLSIDALLG